MDNTDQPIPQAAIAALHMGRQIDAIKIVRKTQGLGLKEAKDRVDRAIANDPMLREKYSALQGQSKRGCFLLLAGLIVLGGLAWFLVLHGKG